MNRPASAIRRSKASRPVTASMIAPTAESGGVWMRPDSTPPPRALFQRHERCGHGAVMERWFPIMNNTRQSATSLQDAREEMRRGVAATATAGQRAPPCRDPTQSASDRDSFRAVRGVVADPRRARRETRPVPTKDVDGEHHGSEQTKAGQPQAKVRLGVGNLFEPQHRECGEQQHHDRGQESLLAMRRTSPLAQGRPTDRGRYRRKGSPK